MFKISKNMVAILVAIMVLAQIGVAHHNTVHFTDHGHIEIVHNEHDHHNHDEEEEHKTNALEACQICVLTESLSIGLTSDNIAVLTIISSIHHRIDNYNNLSHGRKDGLYNPRAPPVFLI